MLMLPFYATLPDADRKTAESLAAPVAQASWERFAPVQDVLPRRTFDNIAQILTHTVPFGEAVQRANSVDFCMWMYLLDYYVDESAACELDRVTTLHERVLAALDGNLPADSPTPFLEAQLLEIMSGFAYSPLGPVLAPVLRKQVEAELAAVRTIIAWSHAEDHPDFETFLAQARIGVNHISCTLSMLFAVDEPLTSAAVEALWPALLDAAVCIRIANDLRTHVKDDAENLLHTLSFEHDKAALTRKIEEHWLDCLRKLDAYVAQGHPPASAEAIRRITRIGMEMYAVTDIRYEL